MCSFMLVMLFNVRELFVLGSGALDSLRIGM